MFVFAKESSSMFVAHNIVSLSLSFSDRITTRHPLFTTQPECKLADGNLVLCCVGSCWRQRGALKGKLDENQPKRARVPL